MKERIDPNRLAEIVREATDQVFSTMLGMSVEAGEAFMETSGTGPFHGVIALVGLAGQWTGSGRISCTPQFACRVCAGLLMSEYEAVNEEVLDAVAEVSNMIIGNVKTTLEEEVGPLGLSIPTVIFGRNYHARSAGISEWTVVPFTCEGEHMEIRFSLVPQRGLSLTHREAGMHAHPA